MIRADTLAFGVKYIAKAIIVIFLMVPMAFTLFPIAIVSDFISIWVVRVGATTVSVVKNPIVHIVAIRKNWRRLVLATDVGTLPEWLPNVEKNIAYQEASLFSVRSLFAAIRQDFWENDWFTRLTVSVFIYWWVAMIIYLIPLIIRSAVKGVSILYTPLFLVINSDPINKKLDLGTRLVEMQHDNASILKRAFAFFAIGSFLLTILFSSLVTKAHDWIRPEATPVFILLAEYYFPPTMRVWQLVSAVNGALFLYLSWIYAPQAARRLEKGVWKTSDVKTYLNRWIGVQMVLSIYSVMCAVAIFANFLLHHQFPARYWQWFPTVGL